MQEPRLTGLVVVPKYKDRDGWWKYLNGGLKPGTAALRPALDIQEAGQPLEEGIILPSDTVGLIKKEELEDTEAPPADDDDDLESEVDFLATKGDDTFVQMTGIINDVPPSPPAMKPAVATSTCTMTTAPPTKRPVTNTLITSPGYSPTFPSTEIITQLENVSLPTS